MSLLYESGSLFPGRGGSEEAVQHCGRSLSSGSSSSGTTAQSSQAVNIRCSVATPGLILHDTILYLI